MYQKEKFCIKDSLFIRMYIMNLSISVFINVDEFFELERTIINNNVDICSGNYCFQDKED